MRRSASFPGHPSKSCLSGVEHARAPIAVREHAFRRASSPTLPYPEFVRIPWIIAQSCGIDTQSCGIDKQCTHTQAATTAQVLHPAMLAACVKNCTKCTACKCRSKMHCLQMSQQNALPANAATWFLHSCARKRKCTCTHAHTRELTCTHARYPHAHMLDTRWSQTLGGWTSLSAYCSIELR
jgi:hypothetical protein